MTYKITKYDNNKIKYKKICVESLNYIYRMNIKLHETKFVMQ